MAVKKRTTLRTKTSKRIGTTLDVSKQQEKIINKLATKSIKPEETKTHNIKSNSTIISEAQNRDPNQPGISKSAIRRRKRKLRDELRPKLTEDLLTALTESTNSTINVNKDGQEEIIIEEKIKLDHTPNPLNKRGEMALYKIENEQFKNVLKNKELRHGGLSALRNSILNNLSKE